MESQAYIRNVPMSPKKLRFLAVGIRGMKPVDAVRVLRYTNKKGAVILKDAILSAMANAKHTLRTTDDLLQCKALIIEEGIKMKRFRAGSKGMAKPYVRAFSHIRVVLTAKGSVKSSTKKEQKPEAELVNDTKKLVQKEEVKAKVATSTTARSTARVAKPKQAEKPKPQRVSRKGM
jgi:large subunit ribosomal protein L22